MELVFADGSFASDHKEAEFVLVDEAVILNNVHRLENLIRNPFYYVKKAFFLVSWIAIIKINDVKDTARGKRAASFVKPPNNLIHFQSPVDGRQSSFLEFVEEIIRALPRDKVTILSRDKMYKNASRIIGIKYASIDDMMSVLMRRE